MSEYLYFQPEYVRRFKCDASKCMENCCAKNWTVDIDAATYEKYSQLKPPEKARELTKLFVYNKSTEKYLLKAHPCPMLTENNLCSLQLEYGEDFLSKTCITYPRRTSDFGYFFERALTLTCSVAAEMILFKREPMKFEFVRIPEKIHSAGGKMNFTPVSTAEGFAKHMLEIQIAMISILQERTLTIDQRLIVLGFFLDKLEELTDIKKVLTAEEVDALVNKLMRLIEAYESKSFLAEHVPRMLASVSFDTKKFIGLVLKIFESLYGGANLKFMSMVGDALQIMPDENGRVSIAKIACNYEHLAAEREKFLARRSTFLKNYLVNELFINCYPWRFGKSITMNYAAFVTTYKIFELILFAVTLKGFDGKNDLLKFVGWYVTQVDHSKEFNEKFLKQIQAAKDIFTLAESLLCSESFLDTKKAVL